MSQLLFGNKFGSLEKLAAYIQVILYTPSLFFFYHFSLISHVFINIPDYSNKIICISYHWIKVSSLGFDLVPNLIVYDKYQMIYG